MLLAPAYQFWSCILTIQSMIRVKDMVLREGGYMKFQALFWLIILTAITSIKFPILSMYMAVGLIPIAVVLLVRVLRTLPERIESLPEVADINEIEERGKPQTSKPYPSTPEEGRFRFYEMYDE